MAAIRGPASGELVGIGGPVRQQAVSMAAIIIQFPNSRCWFSSTDRRMRRPSGENLASDASPGASHRSLGLAPSGSGGEHRMKIHVDHRASIGHPASVGHHSISDSLRRAAQNRHRPDFALVAFVSQVLLDGQ